LRIKIAETSNENAKENLNINNLQTYNNFKKD
jgi:hypothetical protein